MYGEVPPEGIAVTEPLTLLQLSSVELMLKTSIFGSVTDVVAMKEQAKASVIVTVYEPAGSPEIFCVVSALSHKKVYGPAPETGVELAIPSLSELQDVETEAADIEQVGGETQTSKDQLSKDPPSWLNASFTVSVQIPFAFSPFKLDKGS